MSFYDESETRSADQREADLVRALSRAVDDAKHTPGMARTLREVDPDAIIENLSVGQQQRVEILKALYRGAETLILDEPTGVLTPAEADHLFRILRKLKEEGKTLWVRDKPRRRTAAKTKAG